MSENELLDSVTKTLGPVSTLITETIVKGGTLTRTVNRS